MDDETARPGQVIDVRSGEEADDVAELVRSLRKVSSALDRLWHQALSGASGEVAMRLGDASQGVHRALIALREDPGRRPLLAPSLGRGRPAAGTG